jgi:hypothetical protein
MVQFHSGLQGNDMEYLKANENAEVGMVVRLADPKKRYVPHYNNPSIGSEFECSGEILEVRKRSAGDYKFTVRWGNGGRDSYRDGELVLDQEHAKENGVMKSIW